MKKIKRYHIVLFIFLFLILLLAIVTILLNNATFCFIMVVLLLIIEYSLIYLENIKRNKIVKPLIINKEFDKALEYLKLKKDKCLFRGNNIAVVSDMIVINAIIGNLEDSYTLIKEYNLYNNKSLYYVLFQIALSHQNLEKAKVYSKKLLEIKKEKYLPQQQSVKSILKMIETGVCDENILNNTHYPFIKDLCLKYKNSEKIDFNINDNLDIDTVNIKNKKRSISILGIVLLVLSIIAPYSLLIGMSIVAPTTNTEIMHFISQTFKYAWVLMLISITSIVFGFIYRKKGYKALGNIIVGFISVLFLFGMGMLSLSFDVKKTQDVAILNNIYPLEEASLPKDVVMYIVEDEYYRETLIRFNNHIEFNNFYNSLEKRWKTEYNFAVEKKVMKCIGTFINFGTDYYILYSATLDEYNINHIYLNQYYVFIQIDIEDQTVIIKEICVLDYE